MTKVQYKNWKTEIAWLRSMANKCLAMQGLHAQYRNTDAARDFETLYKSLSARADSLEKAKGTAQAS